MKAFIERWNAKMPQFWAKVHKISLWLAGLSLVGGITDYLAQIPDSMLLYPEYIRWAGKAILTLSVIGTVVSKLTKEKNEVV
jgi:hypothetical protein